MSTYKFKIGANAYEVTVGQIADGKADVTVNGKNYIVDIDDFGGQAVRPGSWPAGGDKPVIAVAEPVEATQIPAASGNSSTASTGSAAAGAAGNEGKKVTSPLPGVIIEVSVKEGDTVKAGQKVAVIEAMKMENEIQAESDGTILKIHVGKGDSILEGADIVTIG